MDFGLWTSYSDDKLMALSCVQYSEVYTCILQVKKNSQHGLKHYVAIIGNIKKHSDN